jgi:hypothetical protein
MEDHDSRIHPRLPGSAQRDFHLTRYTNIARLADLTEPYNEGTQPLSDILPRMPAEERAEAEDIIARIAPGGTSADDPGGIPNGQQRHIELARLEAVRERAEHFMKREHLTMHEGQPVLNPGTGEPITDSWPTLNAVDLLMEIRHSVCRLHGLPAPEVTVTADEAAAQLENLPASR